MKFIRITKRYLSKIQSAFLQIFSGEPWNDVWEDGQLKQYLCELAGNKNSLSFGLFDKDELIAISLGRIKHPSMAGKGDRLGVSLPHSVRSA